MGIYDFPNLPPIPEAKEEPKKRSKNRENLTTSQISTGKRTLIQMVEEAFSTLQDAMREADWPTAIKAATAVLDRSGFGPKTTVDVNTTNIDLSELSKEELADRAARVAALIRGQKAAIDATIIPPTVN